MPERRLPRDYVCLKSVFGSPEDGATCGIGSVQWRHHVMMRVTTLVDQDPINFTCSTWQLYQRLTEAKGMNMTVNTTKTYAAGDCNIV